MPGFEAAWVVALVVAAIAARQGVKMQHVISVESPGDSFSRPARGLSPIAIGGPVLSPHEPADNTAVRKQRTLDFAPSLDETSPLN